MFDNIGNVKYGSIYQTVSNPSLARISISNNAIGTESKTTDAIHYLLYSLAVAELNNTDLFLNDSFEQFRVEVSRNLKKLVKHLPDPD